LDDVEDVAPANGFGDRWEARVARTALGAEQTGVTHFRLRAGKRSPFSHRHTHAEEVYVILSGAGKVKLGDEVSEVHPLDAIRVAPEVARAFEVAPTASSSSPSDRTMLAMANRSTTSGPRNERRASTAL